MANPEHGMGWNKPDELRERFDEIMEDLAFGHNFDFASSALWELFSGYTAKAVADVLGKAEDALLDRSIALENEETAVKWDEVVEVLNQLKSNNSAPSPAQEK